MNPSSEALQARADLNATRPPVGLSSLAAAAAMGTADTVRAMLVARSEVNPKLGGETKRGLNEATVKASDEIQDELDESDHAEMLKRYDRRNNKFCQIRSNVSYQFKPWRYWTQPTPSCCAFRSWQSISHWNCEVADRSSAIKFGGSQLSIFKYESFKHFFSSPVNLTSEVRL